MNSKNQYYARMRSIFLNYCDGADLEESITEVYAVYNSRLVNNFIGGREIISARINDDPSIFAAEEWKNDDPSGRREWVKKMLLKKIDACLWNAGEKVPIIPVIHGTSKEIALKICQAGFANLSSLDDGWYGKGIYFSTSAMYCIPYFLERKNPAVLICFLCPGNPYPVTEKYRGKRSLLGKALKSKYQSHYVAVNKQGMIVPKDDIGKTRIYDEIVIPQENQVIPIYVVCFTPDNSDKFKQIFQRELPDSVKESLEAEGIKTGVDNNNKYPSTENNLTDQSIIPNNSYVPSSQSRFNNTTVPIQNDTKVHVPAKQSRFGDNDQNNTIKATEQQNQIDIESSSSSQDQNNNDAYIELDESI